MLKINEKRFYQVLEGVFVGANIEGDSGYVNLLKIKSQYYKIILEQFKKEVDKNPIITDSFKEEFFDRLYSFFEKYFSESGSVYFTKTANWQRVYEQVYTDNKDVVLFWKTHMLYYVKSDILFQSINLEIEDEETKQNYKFYFDVGSLQSKQNNEKKSLVFNFNAKNGDIFVFDVMYSENGKKTKIEDIVKETKISEAIIEKAFTTFKKQSEVDFFVNKDAEKFLSEQLDMYLHQILLVDENKFDQNRLNQLKTVKEFAQKIIKFISQFENELVRVWNKPKFALNSNYVITIDKLSDEIVKKLEKHAGMKDQITEWIEFGMVDKSFDFKKREEKHKYLPLDTKYFKDLEIEILGLFDNLDEALDGRLIHSENYQALNTLQEKYKEKVQCIYIDPPFNLGTNADFDYKVNYKDANWATLLENRLRLAHKLLSDTGSIFVRCDYNGNFIVRSLLDDIFGKENFRNEIAVNRFQKKSDGLTATTESLFLYSKNNTVSFNEIYKPRECIFCHTPVESKWQWSHSAGESKLPRYFTVNNERVLLYPPRGRHWTNSQEKIDLMEKEGRIRIDINTKYTDSNGQKINYIPEKLQQCDVAIDNNWTDIPGYEFGVFTAENFATQNAEVLLERVLNLASDKNNLVLDFFAGSATTQAVAQKIGRKWLGVEMGDQFFNVDLPRLKQVIYGKKSGISKDLKEKYKGSGFFKYEKLEQYEATLRNMKYQESSPSDIFDTRKPFEEYVFYADQKFAHVVENKKDDIELDFEKLYPNIDFAETISNIKGLPIKKITASSVLLEGEEKEIKTDYKNMTKEEKVEFIKLLKPLLWWGE